MSDDIIQWFKTPMSTETAVFLWGMLAWLVLMVILYNYWPEFKEIADGLECTVSIGFHCPGETPKL